MNILIIGYSTRHIVCAAKRAGYTVYSLDHFGDVDLLRCADKYARFDEMPGDDDLLNHLGNMDWDFDAIVLGPGFEYVDLKGYHLLNNRVDITRSIGNKEFFARKMESLGLPHPKIYDITDDFQYPVIIKPIYGAGGIKNRLAYSKQQIMEYGTDIIIQEYLEGIPASVSVISTDRDAVAVAVNEQLIGTPWLTKNRFAYCGNITPFHSEYTEEMCETAVQLILKLGLVGSNGVDFLITEKGPVIIEVNPRFQGTLDTIEYVSGFSIFDAHVKAVEGELVEPPRDFIEDRFAGRAIVFADHDCIIDERISNAMASEQMMDIPQVGWKFSAGDPVTTVFCAGHEREHVLEEIKSIADRIRYLISNP